MNNYFRGSSIEESLGNTGLDYSVDMVFKPAHLKEMLFNFPLTL
jgi:hypothetical protein